MADEEVILNTEENEVIAKYQAYGEKDPFPTIASSLLNSADLHNYILTTGLIAPFYPGNLKQATYGIRLKGEYIYWKNTTESVEGRLEDIKEKDMEGDEVFTLKKNSIAFLQLEPHFRFPSYIAARFNLKIKHIYQGLLLGTGPIVDPGYEGRIFVPLHNLTNTDYKIKINKPLIWMEFTKLSPNYKWDETVAKSPYEYIPYDKEKLKAKRTLRDYLAEAHPNGPIVSTIAGFKEEIDKTRDEAETLVKDGKGLVTTFNMAIIVALFAIAVTLCVGLRASFNNQVQYLENIRKCDQQMQDARQKIIDYKSEQDKLQKDINGLQLKVQTLEAKEAQKSNSSTQKKKP